MNNRWNNLKFLFKILWIKILNQNIQKKIKICNWIYVTYDDFEY